MNFKIPLPQFLFSLAILLLALTDCSQKKKKQIELHLNNAIVDSLITKHGENLAILSCIRCDCFRIEYNNRFIENNEIPKGYVLMADSNCMRLKVPFENLPGSLADKISDDLYNLVFIKKREGAISYKIVSVDESMKVQSIANKFFK